jgi:hypothetical protein
MPEARCHAHLVKQNHYYNPFYNLKITAIQGKNIEGISQATAAYISERSRNSK